MSLVVVKVVGLATIQDFGRRGHMHEGVPPGGALVPDEMMAANFGASNDDGEPVIEVMGQLVVRATAVTIVYETSTELHVLHEGDELVIESRERRCTYLAVRGGVAAREVLDGRGTLLGAGLGSSLRVNDIITSAHSPERQPKPGTMLFTRHEGDDLLIDVLAGPDLLAFKAAAMSLLFSASYRVLPTSNRVGTRLAGPALPRMPDYREVSRPMVQGALEVPGDGQPIVLGPDHPTTGGYPIIAVIPCKALSAFHSVPVGGLVRFTGWH